MQDGALPGRFFVRTPENGALFEFMAEEFTSGCHGASEGGGEAGLASFRAAGEDDHAVFGDDAGEEPGVAVLVEKLRVGSGAEGAGVQRHCLVVSG